jgi:transporter family-2 protein
MPDTWERAVQVLAIPAMLFAGGLVAVQAQISGELAEALGSGPRAGFAVVVITGGTALAFVSVATAVQQSGRAGVRRMVAGMRSGRLKPLELGSGAFGALFVATQGLTVGILGVALFSVGATAGQAAGGLWADRAGLGPSGRQPLSVPRAIAALFAVVAVLLAAGERLAASFTLLGLSLIALPVLAGIGTSIQQGLNGRLSAIGGPWATTILNFAVGTALVTVVWAASFAAPGHLLGLPSQPWLYAGGAVGVAYIWLAAVLVKVHGVLVLALSMIAGHVTCAEVLELLSEDPHVGALGIAAGVLTVVGVALAVLWKRPTAQLNQ